MLCMGLLTKWPAGQVSCWWWSLAMLFCYALDMSSGDHRLWLILSQCTVTDIFIIVPIIDFLTMVMVLDDTYTIDGEASLSTVNFSVLSKCWGCVSWKDLFLEDIVSTQINWLSGWNWSVLGKSDFNNKICLRNWFEKSRLGTPSMYAPNREVAWIER